VDKRLYLDVNRLAGESSWAHAIASLLARSGGMILLGLLVLLALWSARRRSFGGSDLDRLAAVAWVVIGTAVAFLVALPVCHLVARARPFVAVPHAAVIGARTGGFSFPSEHAVVAGATAAGLWFCGTRLIAAAASLLALAIAFSEVYIGLSYPSDVVAGLLIGIFVTLVGYPLAIGPLRAATHRLSKSPAHFLVGGGPSARSFGAGPAAHPEPVGEGGGVRILPKQGEK